MRHSEESGHKFRIYYGWYVLAAIFVILFFNAGARFSIGVFFKPMITEFGWDRSSISLAFFLNMSFFGLSLIIVGKLYDRYGPKWVIIISTLFYAGGYMCISRINSLWQYLFFYGIFAALGLGGNTSLLVAITSKWFDKYRGLAASLALCGSCAGQFVLVPFFTMIVIVYGWRISYFGIGLIMLVVNIALVLLVIKGDPDDLGYRPLGFDNSNAAAIKKGQDIVDQDLGLMDAMKTRSFWLFFILMCICGSGDFLVTTHLIPFVTDYNISPVTAGNMLGWYGFMSGVGILIAGPASDLIGNKIPITITFVLRFLLFLLILKYQNLVSFYIFALGFGFTFLITGPLTPTLLGKICGLSHLGILTGFINAFHHGCGGLWAYVGGYTFDQTGSYRLVFILSAIMSLVAVLCSVFIEDRRHRVA